MPLSREQNCLVVHIPRTGGTSLVQALNIPQSPEALNGVFRVENRYLPGEQLVFQFQHLSLIQIKNLLSSSNLNFEQFYKVSFTRNPWDRVVSDYANCYHRYCEDFKEYILKLKRIVGFINTHYKHEMSSSFYQQYSELIYETIGEKKWVDPHFFPQTLLIENEDGEIDLDFIGRFETYSQDVDRMLSKVGHQTKVEHKNASVHEPYQNYYDQETMDIVWQIYQCDIENFNYRF